MREKRWNERYAVRQGSDFKWYIEEPPKELTRLLDSVTIVKDTAVDLGCGPGAITVYLCQHFRRVIGLDIAENGLRQAQARARKRNAAAVFIAGDARRLPFAGDSIDFIFDRGCLQGIPLPDWPSYFEELERIMKAGGVVQILCRYRRVKPLSWLPWELWANRKEILKQSDSHRSPRHLPTFFSAAFEQLRLEETPFMLNTGVKIYFTHAIYRKRINQKERYADRA